MSLFILSLFFNIYSKVEQFFETPCRSIKLSSFCFGEKGMKIGILSQRKWGWRGNFLDTLIYKDGATNGQKFYFSVGVNIGSGVVL